MCLENKVIKAVIFDMDGVLIDSEPIHIETWQDVIKSFNLNRSDKWFKQWIGTSDETVAKHFSENYHISQSWQQLLTRKRSLYINVLNEKLNQTSLLVNFSNINKLNNYKLGIATSSSRNEVNAVLRKLKLSNVFDVIIAGEDVINGKPAPDIYLLAAKKINVNPENCVALEDSPYGIEAAKQAGMFVIGITSSFHKENLQQANILFNSTIDAIEWLHESLKKVKNI